MTDTVAIIAGGLSLKGADLSPLRGRCHTIDVNDTWRALRWVDETFTIDTLQIQRRFSGNHGRVVIAVPEHYGTPRAAYHCDRAPKIKGYTYVRRIVAPGLSDDPGSVHSGENSAYGALNWAYHRLPRRIVLFGVDLVAMGQHWHGLADDDPAINGIDRRIADNFAGAVPQLQAMGIEVINASPVSLIDCFERVSVAEGIAACL